MGSGPERKWIRTAEMKSIRDGPIRTQREQKNPACSSRYKNLMHAPFASPLAVLKVGPSLAHRERGTFWELRYISRHSCPPELPRAAALRIRKAPPNRTISQLHRSSTGSRSILSISSRKAAEAGSALSKQERNRSRRGEGRL
eukprot:609560-Rhodomonas_salina.4